MALIAKYCSQQGSQAKFKNRRRLTIQLQAKQYIPVSATMDAVTESAIFGNIPTSVLPRESTPIIISA